MAPQKIGLAAYWKELLGLIVLLAGILGSCWGLVATPLIQKQIDESQKPIIEAVNYLRFMQMQSLSQEQIEQADRQYTAWKRGNIQ